jgi:stage V sporulation protein D (sporulation-specific penicillin-binding protein)
MRYMEIPPTYASSVPSPEPTSGLVAVPNLYGLAEPESRASLKAAGLVCRTQGTGTVVTNQVPKAGSRVAAGTTVVVYFGPEELYNLEGDFVEVPDVTGKTLKEAAVLLGARGLTVQPMGRGVVARQEPLGGASAMKGSPVTIFLEE